MVFILNISSMEVATLVDVLTGSMISDLMAKGKENKAFDLYPCNIAKAA